MSRSDTNTCASALHAFVVHLGQIAAALRSRRSRMRSRRFSISPSNPDTHHPPRSLRPSTQRRWHLRPHRVGGPNIVPAPARASDAGMSAQRSLIISPSFQHEPRLVCSIHLHTCVSAYVSIREPSAQCWDNAASCQSADSPYRDSALPGPFPTPASSSSSRVCSDPEFEYLPLKDFSPRRAGSQSLCSHPPILPAQDTTQSPVSVSWFAGSTCTKVRLAHVSTVAVRRSSRPTPDGDNIKSPGLTWAWVSRRCAAPWQLVSTYVCVHNSA